MERLRGMYEHSELVLFLQGPNQTAALNSMCSVLTGVVSFSELPVDDKKKD